jgi:predicted ATPase/class 3 adenylate cyclase
VSAEGLGAHELPTGTVTFLFTDLEGSTRLLEAHPAAYREALRRHHTLLREAVEASGGVVFETVGDAVYAAFARPAAAVAAAVAGQRALLAGDWGALGAGALAARMALHPGEVDLQGGHYFGAPLYRCARLLAAAHGGQTVLSEAAAALVRGALPAGAGLRDLGAHRLKDLQQPERVAQLLHPDLPADFPPLRTLDALPNNLPVQLTSFVGREPELAEVGRLLAATRLLTLTGTGGTGKTRLALQAAAGELDAFPDGVWVAELAPLADPALVPQAVAAAAGLVVEPGRSAVATLCDAWRARRVLLILDNCEHVLAACAELADALLRACPRLTVLATSRESLGIGGETSWRVPSLTLPAAGGVPTVAALTQYEAVRLFIERAKAALPSFTVTDRNAPAVAQVCARLDGIPLALELAAARIRTLTPEQLLARLEDRFRLLTGGSRTALERHQTLQALVEWSHDLLAASERALFARLAVFAGGWTLEAAEAVGADDTLGRFDVDDVLSRLVDKSLALADDLPDASRRYRLLETVRQFGHQKLLASGEADATRARHLAHFLELAETAEPRLATREAPAWIDRLEAEHDNLRAALEWSLAAGSPPEAAHRGLRLVGALAYFWFLRYQRREGRAWLERALARTGATPTRARATALWGAGALYVDADVDLRLALRYLEESASFFREHGEPARAAYALAMMGWHLRSLREDDAATARWNDALALARAADDPRGMALPLIHMAYSVGEPRDPETRQRLLDEALPLAERSGDPLLLAMAYRVAGDLALQRGDLPAARAAFGADLANTRALKETVGIWGTLVSLGRVAARGGDLAAARRHYTEARALQRDSGAAPRMLVGTACRLAELALLEGEPAAARAGFVEALALARQAGDPGGLAAALEGLATVAAATAGPGRAVTLAGAAAALRERSGRPMPAADRPVYERWLAPASAALDEGARATALAAGRALTSEQAIAYALADAPATA